MFPLDYVSLGLGALHPAQLLDRERRGAAALCPVRPRHLRRRQRWRQQQRQDHGVRVGQHLLRHRVSGLRNIESLKVRYVSKYPT